MLADTVFAHWRDAVAARAATLRPPDAAQAQDAVDAFTRLQELDENALRAALADAPHDRNRLIATLLFERALSLAPGGEARAYVEWAALVAEYGDALHAGPVDALEGHCDALRGAIAHRAGDFADAQRAYARAETSYAMAADATRLHALVVLAQGVAALDGGNVHERRAGYMHLVPERFARAAEIAARADDDCAAIVAAVVERASHYAELVDRITGPMAHAMIVDDLGARPDDQLARLLRSRLSDAMAAGDAAAIVRLSLLLERLRAPSDAPGGVLEEVARDLLARKQGALAAEVLEVLRARDPQRRDVRRLLAHARLIEGEREECCTLLEALLHEDDGDREAMELLLAAQVDLEAPRVRELCERLLALDPQHPMALHVARMLPPDPRSAVSVDDDGAVVTIDADALASDPQELAVALTTALVLRDPANAPQLLQELAERDPALAQRVIARLVAQGVVRTAPRERSVAQRHLDDAEEHFGHGRLDDAARAYREAIAADRDLALAYMGLGDVHYRRGEYHLAAAHFEESIDIRPVASTYRFLGDALLRVGREDGARTAYEQALTLDPEYVGARQALAHLDAARSAP
ncbi:MAG: tetratricopeptide repeat protein [Gemmatirosa sp.]